MYFEVLTGTNFAAVCLNHKSAGFNPRVADTQFTLLPLIIVLCSVHFQKVAPEFMGSIESCYELPTNAASVFPQCSKVTFQNYLQVVLRLKI